MSYGKDVWRKLNVVNGLRSFTSQFNPSGKGHNMSRDIDVEAGFGMGERVQGPNQRNHIPSFSYIGK